MEGKKLKSAQTSKDIFEDTGTLFELTTFISYYIVNQQHRFCHFLTFLRVSQAVFFASKLFFNFNNLHIHEILCNSDEALYYT